MPRKRLWEFVFHKFYPHAKVQKIPCGAEENYEFESNWWGAFLRDSGFVQQSGEENMDGLVEWFADERKKLRTTFQTYLGEA